MASVVLRNLTKQYAGNSEPSLHALTWRSTDGEFVCLVGPSGCGRPQRTYDRGLETSRAEKSKLVVALSNDLPSRDRDIALVFQSYALYHI